jgi:hypothetical protein
MSAKTEGQEASLATLTEQTWDAFKLVLTIVPDGALFTVNTVRVFLDWADIPQGARGGLFARAARAGMMSPAMQGPYTLMEPTEGTSGKGAGVKVYRRAGATS